MIGSGQIAAICGLSRFTTPLVAWSRLMGYEPQASSEEIELGNALEEPIAREAARRHDLGALSRAATLLHPSIAWAKATPDRWLHGSPWADLAILEAKNVGLSPGPSGPLEDWRDGALPDYVAAQVQWQLGLWKAQESPNFSGIAFVAALLGGRELVLHRVDFDAALFADMVVVAANFREKHILTNMPPSGPDGSEGYDRYLRGRFPRANGSWIVVEGDEDEQLLAALRHAENKSRVWQAIEKQFKQRVQGRIGENLGIIGAAGSVCWSERREYTVKEHVVKASRRLVTKWKEEGDEARAG